MRMNNIEILITNNNTKLTDIEWNVQQSLKKGTGGGSYHESQVDD